MAKKDCSIDVYLTFRMKETKRPIESNHIVFVVLRTLLGTQEQIGRENISSDQSIFISIL